MSYGRSIAYSIHGQHYFIHCNRPKIFIRIVNYNADNFVFVGHYFSESPFSLFEVLTWIEQLFNVVANFVSYISAKRVYLFILHWWDEVTLNSERFEFSKDSWFFLYINAQ